MHIKGSLATSTPVRQMLMPSVQKKDCRPLVNEATVHLSPVSLLSLPQLLIP
ncbi:MAG: hypothetical protein SO071_04840 [Prevotella sp.]|nr:hypothetical protein [Prevotella sp.]MDY3966205.1 hypothetical protein [Prevotella sp.]MDY4990486.1 hypothetical protein [Prevotella sp.]